MDADSEEHQLRQENCRDCLAVVELVVTGGYTKPITDDWLTRHAPVAVRNLGVADVRDAWETLVTKVHRHRRKARKV